MMKKRLGQLFAENVSIKIVLIGENLKNKGVTYVEKSFSLEIV